MSGIKNLDTFSHSWKAGVHLTVSVLKHKAELLVNQSDLKHKTEYSKRQVWTQCCYMREKMCGRCGPKMKLKKKRKRKRKKKKRKESNITKPEHGVPAETTRALQRAALRPGLYNLRTHWRSQVFLVILTTHLQAERSQLSWRLSAFFFASSVAVV